MRYWILCPIFGVVMCGLLAGCTSSGGGASYEERDTIPPRITSFDITPPAGDWRGGACQITVAATDNDAVADVMAGISGPGINTQVPLTGSAATSYVGSVSVPPNTHGDGKANTYYVTAWALDASGNSSTVTESLSFAIAAPEGPPIGPPVDW